MKKMTKFFAPILACLALVLTGCNDSDVGADFSFTDHFGTTNEAIGAEMKKKLDLTMPLIKLSGKSSTDAGITQGDAGKGVVELVVKDVPLDISTAELTKRVGVEIKAIEDKVNAYHETPEGKAWIEGALKAREEAIGNGKSNMTFEGGHYQTSKDESDGVWVNAQILTRMLMGKL